MKKLFSIAIIAFIFSNLSNAQALKSRLDSVSYSLGIMYAQNLIQQGVTELNPAVFAQAIDDKINGKTLAMKETQCNQTSTIHLQELKRKKEEAQKAAGQKFLADNGKRKGVVTLPSGLQYEVLKEGTGEKPKATDQVTTHYHGTLIDGTVFDSSVQRGEPATFPVSGVIKGWVEALQLMPVGSKWKLYVPSDLAYGSRGAGGKIGPHTTLIFEVELLSIAGQ